MVIVKENKALTESGKRKEYGMGEFLGKFLVGVMLLSPVIVSLVVFWIGINKE